MKGSIRSLATGNSTGQLDGVDGLTYEYYLTDFSPDELATGLDELESVEFEPVHGDVNRAMNCVRLTASQRTPAVAESESASDNTMPEDLPLLYSPPTPAPLLCKGQLPPEWEIISISDWCVRGASQEGTDEARRLIAQRARELNANAILNLEYSITGTDKGAGKTHAFQGRLAIVGKIDPKGKPRELLAADLNQPAENVLKQLELRRQSAQRKNFVLYAICAASTLIAGALAGVASLPTLIVGTIALGASLKLRQATTLDEYVTLNPIEPSANSNSAA